MNYFILQTLFWLLLAFIIGLILGKWIKRLLCRQNNTKHTSQSLKKNAAKSYSSTADKLAIRSKDEYPPPSSSPQPEKSSVSVSTVALGATAAAGVVGHVANQASSNTDNDTVETLITTKTTSSYSPSSSLTNAENEIDLKDIDLNTAIGTLGATKDNHTTESESESNDFNTMTIDNTDIKLEETDNSLASHSDTDTLETIKSSPLNIKTEDIDTVQLTSVGTSDTNIEDIEATVNSTQINNLEITTTDDITTIDSSNIVHAPSTIVEDSNLVDDSNLAKSSPENDDDNRLLSKGVAGVTAHLLTNENDTTTVDSESTTNETKTEISESSNHSSDTIISSSNLSEEDSNTAINKARQTEIDSFILKDVEDDSLGKTTNLHTNNHLETENNSASISNNDEVEETSSLVDSFSDSDLLSKGITAAGVATAGFVTKSTSDSNQLEEDSDTAMKKAKQAEIGSLMLDTEGTTTDSFKTNTDKAMDESSLLSKGAAAVSAAGLAGVAITDDMTPNRYLMSLGDGASVIAGLDSSNLRIIEGIAPKMEAVLHANHIRTWRDLSLRTDDQLRIILDKYDNTYKGVVIDNWVEQACLLADGKVDELITFQKETLNNSQLENWLKDT